MKKNHTEVPTLDNVEITLLESNWFTIVDFSRIKYLHHVSTLSHEALVLDSVEVKRHAVTTTLGFEIVANDFDFSHLGFGITHIISMIVHWVTPWIVFVMTLVVVSLWSF
jgi:hypothetical protein